MIILVETTNIGPTTFYIENVENGHLNENDRTRTTQHIDPIGRCISLIDDHPLLDG